MLPNTLGYLPLSVFFNILARCDLFFSRKFLCILVGHILSFVLVFLQIRLYFIWKRFEMGVTYINFFFKIKELTNQVYVVAMLNTFCVGIIMDFKYFLCHPFIKWIINFVFYFLMEMSVTNKWVNRSIKTHLFMVEIEGASKGLNTLNFTVSSKTFIVNLPFWISMIVLVIVTNILPRIMICSLSLGRVSSISNTTKSTSTIILSTWINESLTIPFEYLTNPLATEGT